LNPFPHIIVQFHRFARKVLSIIQYFHEVNEIKVEARKIYCLQYLPSQTSSLNHLMNTLSLRSLLALSVAALLAACGGGADTSSDAPLQTAAVVQTSGAPTQANATVAANQAPQPDCAPQGCNGLRIIDANAEEYRLEAQRRAALEASGNNIQ
jgi:hypothetical protein